MKRTVFITGGTKGIGFELVKKYLSEGFIVATCSIEHKEETELPNEVEYYKLDVRDKVLLSDAINSFYQKHNILNYVIANAGIRMNKSPIPDFEEGRKVIDINIHGVLNTFEPAIKIMKEQGFGSLSALASVSGIFGLPGMAIYGASKSAVIHLCESLEIDLLPFGINVSVVAPGFIKTEQALSNRHPLPFMIDAKDAAFRIYKQLSKKKGRVVFPIPMKLISIFLYYLPRSIYKKLMSFDFLGLSK